MRSDNGMFGSFSLVFLQLAVLLLLLDPVHGNIRTSVSQAAMSKCHRGVRTPWERRCHEYTTGTPEKLAESTQYPEIEDWCYYITWYNATADNNWGNCMNMTTDDEFRYITSNTVPDFYFNPYCPIGIGSGYCVQQEIDTGKCFFPDLVCGQDNGPGTTPYGDVWIAQPLHYKIPLVGNPTRSGIPWDMYDCGLVGCEKDSGPATAVAVNGVGIQGPNDAGDVSIDEGGFILACGGHVTPPIQDNVQKYHLHDVNSNFIERPDKTPLPPPPGASPPLYHFHKSPECLQPFKNASIGYDHGANPYKHGELVAWAIDGFGVYTYQDVGGSAPVVDECGGHFGPVDTGEVVYHYHSRPIVPYHLACQGPSLGECAATQDGTNYCHPGCGAEVCVQPGTNETELRQYLAKWDDTWYDTYGHNDYSNICNNNS